ncbi:MAG: PhnD/SsuA/transferrin family substrate-binding protein, partial [Desulfurivibrionaceae bacterium]
SEEQHRQLREIYRAKPAAPSFLVMAHPKTDQATILRLRQSLLGFKDTPEGKDFLQKSQFESFLPIDEATMERIDPYVHVFVQPR